MMATLKYQFSLPNGATFRPGQQFLVIREFTARGIDGPVRCLSLGYENGAYVVPCILKSDVTLQGAECEDCGESDVDCRCQSADA